MFHIGQRVVCIHDVGSRPANEFPNVPIKGSIYTVRGFVSPDVGYERTPGMLLEEVVNPPWEYKEGVFEPSFHPYHFRPLVQHKTDISVFTRMPDRCAWKSQPPSERPNRKNRCELCLRSVRRTRVFAVPAHHILEDGVVILQHPLHDEELFMEEAMAAIRRAITDEEAGEPTLAPAEPRTSREQAGAKPIKF